MPLVDNKGGGGGIPGVEVANAAAPDGYTFLIAISGTFGVNPSLYADLPYKPLVDFKPITNIIRGPLVIVAHPSFPASTIAELIELARKEPGKHSYASAGPGTAQHLSDLAEDGHEIPDNTAWEDVKSDPDVKEFMRAMVSVRIPPKVPRTVKISLSIDEEVLERIDRAVKRCGETRSGFFARAAGERAGGLRAVLQEVERRTRSL